MQNVPAHLALLAVGDLDVAPAAVDHVSLGQDAHLRFVVVEADEPEPLGLACLDIFLDLEECFHHNPSLSSTVVCVMCRAADKPSVFRYNHKEGPY